MRTWKAFYRATCRALLSSLLGGSCWLASGCSGAHEPAQHGPEAGYPRQTTVVKPAADVPALLGKPIEGLAQQLGAAQPVPASFEASTQYAEIAPRATDSVVAFRAKGLLLVAGYDIRSRAVHDLLLLGQHEDSLMQRGTLREDAPGYLVLPLFASDRPGHLLGLRVIEAKRPR